jgi:hypothetical protein
MAIMTEECFAPSSGAERRAWVRYPCNLETLCQPGEGRLDQPWWFAKVRDLSQHGIGLILNRPFELGDQLTVALYSPTLDVSRTLEARVAHIEPAEPGTWVVGCAFQQAISAEEMRAFWSEQRLSQAADTLP